MSHNQNKEEPIFSRGGKQPACSSSISMASGPLDPFSGLASELKYEITNYLSSPDMACLARCSRIWNKFAVPVLYLRNAATQNSSAIKWAVLYASQPTGLKILQLAIQHGGDVNAVHEHKVRQGSKRGDATALHISAARGIDIHVNFLLQHGANVSAHSKELSQLSGLDIEQSQIEDKLFNSALAVGSRHAFWLPLFVPFVLGYEDVVRLLLMHGASPELAIDNSNREVPDDEPLHSLTIPHVLAANDMRSTTDDAGNCLFQRSRSCINRNLPGGGDTPLHIALRNPNPSMLDKLILAGANIEATADLGRTPLMLAIGHCYRSKSSQKRNTYVDCIERLIQAGADVNVHANHFLAQTPLIAAVKGMPLDWKNMFPDMYAIVNLLLDNGARVNERSSRGLAIVHVLCEMIHRKGGSSQLETLLREFISQGADVNLPYPAGGTIMKRFIVDNNHQPMGLFRLLLDAGATILDHEADAVLERWCTYSHRDKRSYDILKHKDSISQQAIDKAYFVAWDGQPNKFYMLLRDHFPAITAGERLVAKVLASPKMKLGPTTLDLPFNPKYIDENGDSFLHLIVNRLQKHPTYKESTAVADATALIERGASVCDMNGGGETVLQRLGMMSKPYSQLSLLLHETNENENENENDT